MIYYISVNYVFLGNVRQSVYGSAVQWPPLRLASDIGSQLLPKLTTTLNHLDFNWI